MDVRTVLAAVTTRFIYTPESCATSLYDVEYEADNLGECLGLCQASPGVDGCRSADFQLDADTSRCFLRTQTRMEAIDSFQTTTNCYNIDSSVSGEAWGC